MPRAVNSSNHALVEAVSSTGYESSSKLVASNQSNSKVNIIPVKRLVIEKFPKGSAIFDVITTEKDELSPSEYVAKVDIWLKLLRRDNR